MGWTASPKLITSKALGFAFSNLFFAVAFIHKTLNVDTIRLDYAVWQRHLGNRLAKPLIIRLACQQGRSSTVTAEDPSQRPNLVAFIGQKYVGALLTRQHSVIEQRRCGELT